MSLNSLLIIHDSQPIYMLPPYGTTISNICIRGVINVFAMVWVQYECSLKVLVPRIVVLTSTKSLKEVESSGQREVTDGVPEKETLGTRKQLHPISGC